MAVLTAETEVVTLYNIMARQSRQFAGFNQMGLDEHDEPHPEDLRSPGRRGPERSG